MPKIDRPREDRGRGPTGEKHPCSAEASGGQSAGLIPPCDLCALLLRPLRNRPKPGRAPRGAGRRLRIALVDNDEATRLAARKMVQAQRDGWILDTCRSCCLASGASGLPQKLRLGPDTHTQVAADGSRRSHRRENNAPTTVGGYALPAGRAEVSRPGIPPDIVLIGLARPTPAAFACVRKLKALSPAIPMVIISGRCDGGAIVQACLAGADGWLVNSVAPAKLARAISSVVQGVPVLCEEAAMALVHFLRRTGTSLSAHDLTAREQEIVGCLAAKLSDNQISDWLPMSMHTLHSHLGHIFKKLGVHNRRQALRKLLGGGRRLTFS